MKKVDRIHLQKVADLGCVVCRNLGFGYSPAEIHHLRKGCGAGQRSAHKRSIPLCPPHHRNGGYGVAIHSGQRKWEENYGSEEALLEQVNRELAGEFTA
ncbi:Ref family recombination enhancement nuclease [Enterobacter cloacae complex sp. 2022EL-00788]|uniref:Ref family recombination enhancement nuclease n=1 Tax=Enterobacter cloacae complex sp. 2022EL-00788 TaxID=2996512 RepID=UPI0022709F77|nr:Ref family recombination enhancement nuclease [Enterobacter cloacae complex sp. 2022EL-00788]MCY0771285.1 Ref family recombination enhancement nuclease [Enterobacter cloacae complex sp. 2022EL-00788]